MAVTRIEVERKKGDTFDVVVFLKQVVDGSLEVFDPTGYTFELSVHDTDGPQDPPSYLFQVAGSILDVDEGSVAFEISAANADYAGDYWYDIKMTETSSTKIQTIADGKWGLDL